MDATDCEIWAHLPDKPIWFHKKIAVGLTLSHAVRICNNANSAARARYIYHTLRDEECPRICFYYRRADEPLYMIMLVKNNSERIYRIAYNAETAKKILENLQRIYSPSGPHSRVVKLYDIKFELKMDYSDHIIQFRKSIPIETPSPDDDD